MSAVRIIGPGEPLIDTVAALLHPEERDYSRSIVVFPGKRPAHFLRKALGERNGSAIIPPRIFSIDHFIEFLHAEATGTQAQAIDPVDAVALLYDVHSGLEPKLGNQSFLSLDAFLPLALRLFGELEEVALGDLSDRRIRETLSTVDYPKFHSLGSYYERFYAEAAARGFVTRSMMYRAVADLFHEIDLSSYNRIVLAGFYAFTHVERRIVAHLHALNNVTLLFQNGMGLKRQLEHLSIDVPEAEFPSADDASYEPVVHFYKAPDAHGQVLALATMLQERLKQGERLDERTAVVLPSAEALFPALHLPLSLLEEEAYNISLGYPLERTPVYGFLNNLMELVAGSFNGKFPAQAYVRFILHPYTKNIRFEKRSELTRIIVHSIEEYFAERSAQQFLDLRELENDRELADFILRALQGTDSPPGADQLRTHLKTIHDNTIRKFMAFGSLGEFARNGIGVLSYISDTSTANLHPFFRPYAQQLIEVLDGVSRSLLAGKRFESEAGYFAFFRQYVAAQSVPFPGTPLHGLQVLGLLETRNLKFDTVYLLDANDDVLPSKPGDDLLLLQPIRKILGLETNRDREQLAEYYFNLIVDGAKETHVFYTETESGGKEKSRFVQKLIWNRERRAGRLLAAELEQVAKYSVSLVSTLPVAIPKTEEMVEFLRGQTFSASQLDTYLACPIRFYYQNVLRLRERRETSDDLDDRDIGSLVHRILAEFFKPVMNRRLTQGDLDEARLDETIDRCFREEYGEELIGPAHFFKKQVTLQLKKFMAAYQLPLLQDHEVIVEGAEVSLQAELGGVVFTGRIDRMETRDGKTCIIDYKTGFDDSRVRIRSGKLNPNDRATWRKAIGSFQLPIYMLLAARAGGKKLEEILPLYLFLGNPNAGPKTEAGIENDEQTAAEVYRGVEQVIISMMMNEIFDAKVPFSPTDTPHKDCPSCPYNTICGTQWVRGWRG
ncbi:MAG: PD-(D/E)XK nuclease family protein [Bacteroidota bacterium]